MAFTLPPEPQDRQVTVTIPAAVDPYFKQWYLQTRKQGETPEQFAYRNLAKAGLAWRQEKLKQDALADIKAQFGDEQAELDTIVLDQGLG